ncbi:hypothetical protein L0Y59_05355, partial [Candidatus Uhrbacteria bacterium]|nr:hypothetical protein [Candidatus Uhrbacteria bacterium]
MVRDLGTGQTRRLTNKPPGSLEFFAASAEPSPDGTQVVYSWYNANDFVDLRIVGFDGSNARVLFADPALKGEVYPVAWSPDGGTILATHYAKDGATRILTVSVLDGSVRFLNVKGRKPSRLRFSPDGRYIAYDFGESGTLDIAVLAADGTRETPVVQHSGNDVLFDWTPDGKRLLFGSDRSGTMGAWWIEVADGQPAGTPELIKPDLGHVRPVGFTRDGSFYYRVSTALSDVYIAEIDVGTGRVLAPPIPASDRYVGFNERPAWSPDGRELLFLSARGPGYYGAKAICIRRTDSGDVREIASELKNIVGIHWFPDGRSLLAAARGAGGGRPTVFRVDVGSGAF